MGGGGCLHVEEGPSCSDCPAQVMKTYHMYHTESISAESKLKDAEKQEEKQFSKSGDLNVNLLRHDDRPPRRSSARKIEKMKEKVSSAPWARRRSTLLCGSGSVFVSGLRSMLRRPLRLPDDLVLNDFMLC